jgi:transcriptional regulator with XRE-family HTH domain
MKVNEKIRTIRQLKEFSQEVIAEKLGISKNTYANIERGETDVQMSRMEQIAQTFEMDLVELFNFGEKTVTCLIGNSNNHFSNIGQNVGDSKETHFEIKKLQLFVEQQLKEIAYLKQIIELTKSQQKETN